MRAISGTTVTVPLTPHPVYLTTGKSAAGEAAVRVGAASALNQGPSGTPARNAPPALMPVAQRGNALNAGFSALEDCPTTRPASGFARMRSSPWKRLKQTTPTLSSACTRRRTSV
ncbi:hypothetical protein J4Q44_G00148620 [Coregonus suidteri]|uniref:Uncharacterized protein n=1 Tax=Coregonus suidteri TaxID=861788 RepID=A0AAN8QYD8_9TELE